MVRIRKYNARFTCESEEREPLALAVQGETVCQAKRMAFTLLGYYKATLDHDTEWKLDSLLESS